MDTGNKPFNLMELSPGGERLLLTLIFFAGAKGECYPSQATLMNALKISKKPVLRRYVDELVRHNLVSYQKSLTRKKLPSGKTVPAPQIKYFVVSDKLYLTDGERTDGLYLNFSSREGPLGTHEKVTGIIHKTVYKNILDGSPSGSPSPETQKTSEGKKTGKAEGPESHSPYRDLVTQFNEKYRTELIPTFGKQAKAIKKILQSKFTEKDIWECAEWLDEQKWWHERGFDFADILSQISKYKQTHSGTSLHRDDSPMKGKGWKNAETI